jgi:glycosyltransferase involved in cell wall biosynthesis
MIPSKFIIIVPFYNVAQYLKECIDSITSQNYFEYVVIFADDCSSDGSSDLIDDNNPKFIKYYNPNRTTALENIHNSLMRYHAEHTINDDDIIVGLDGDDKLLHNDVLKFIDKTYLNTNCMITYGQYVTSSGYMGHCGAYSEEQFSNLRQMDWRASHLRTFKWSLYKQLLIQDPILDCYKDDDGGFYKITYDIAIMYPLMEIAGYKRIYFNNVPLYWYRIHANNDYVIDAANQKRVEYHIRNKPKFKQLYA